MEPIIKIEIPTKVKCEIDPNAREVRIKTDYPSGSVAIDIDDFNCIVKEFIRMRLRAKLNNAELSELISGDWIK